MRDRLARKRLLSREDIEGLAEQVVQLGSNGDQQETTFMERLASRLDQKKIAIPTVQIEVRNLHVEAEALVGSEAIPSLSNAAKSTLKGVFSRLMFRSKETKKLNILKNYSGILKPGRMTLVLGPPGSGKSVFLQMLAGKLKSSPGLKVSGEIKYNGVSPNDFIIERTTAHVEQLDKHLGSLTVHETLSFAHKCQQAQEGSSSEQKPFAAGAQTAKQPFASLDDDFVEAMYMGSNS